MSAVRTLENLRLELLTQFFSAATHDASAAMCRWTSGLISLTLDEVREVPIADVAAKFDLGDELLTMVVLTLQGAVGGDMILTFDEANGRALAAALTQRPLGTTAEWSDLERSALTETGNILGCAYMNALTRLIDVELVPSPPYFIQDYGASVLEQALMAQAAECEEALVCRTTFHREREELHWNVFFVPTHGLRQKLEAAFQSLD